jgi:hypothetical protein
MNASVKYLLVAVVLMGLGACATNQPPLRERLASTHRFNLRP